MENVEEETPQDVILTAAELRFQYKLELQSNNKESINTWNKLLDLFKQYRMISFYKTTCEENNQPIDNKLIKEWEEENNKQLKEIENKKEEAKKSEGDVEVHNIELERALFLSRTASCQESIDAYLNIKNLTSGKNIDKYLTILRICLAWKDDHAFKKHATVAQKLIDKGGDWDRRNRFIVYEALHCLRIRDFKQAASKFLDAISTFTATEVFNYRKLVLLTVISSLVSLERVDLKKKIVDSPEIRTVIHEIPNLQKYLTTFYDCAFNEFFVTLCEVMKYVRSDYYLSLHANYYLREIRLRAYQFFLQSYRSVQLASMAKAFGVSEDFLDYELSSFISSNRITCKIDKVHGVVEMIRIDKRNEQYQDIMKKGDALLSRVQRLSRIITY